MQGAMRMMRWPALALVTFLMACSSGSPDATGPGGNNNNGGGNPSANTVLISGFAFHPTPITVAAGTTVTFTNNDAATHTATADDGSFNSGDLATGASFTHTFGKAGTYTYRCAIHPSMKGSVVVQ